MSNQIIKIQVPDGEIYSIDCADPATRCEVYGELLTALTNEGFPHEVSDFKLVDAQGNDIDNDVAIEYSQDLIYLKMLKYNIYVQDKGVVCSLIVNTDCTIEDIRAEFESREGRKIGELPWDQRQSTVNDVQKMLGNLSINGQRLAETETLQDVLKEGCTLRGLLQIIISDVKCETETPIDIYDYETIEDVLRRYHETHRRWANPNAALTHGYTACEHSHTIYECKIEHDSTVEYTTPPFTIKIKEKNDDLMKDVVVEDYFTVQMVKDEYSKIADEGLVDGDKLICGPQSMDEAKEIYKYMINEKSIIHVEREDITQMYHGYYCADCGSPIQLKKDDQLRCRNCGYRIVFKNRTTRACQYLAR